MRPPVSMPRPIAALVTIALLAACSDPPAPQPAPAAEPGARGEQQAEATAPGAAQADGPAPGAAQADGPAPGAAQADGPAPGAAPPDANEACGRMIVVAYAGAKFAASEITRSKPQASERARDLLANLRQGGDFAALAAAESDAPTSAARGGVMGTYAKADWPELHGALRDPLFALQVGAVAEDVVEAPYGYVLLGRCSVEKARSRHVLLRYAGAKNADDGVARSKDEARARAQELLSELAGGADFAQVAKQHSDDSSAERGGDIGSRGRGVLAKAYEDALFALEPGQRSAVVESEFGFHIIERLSD